MEESFEKIKDQLTAVVIYKAKCSEDNCEHSFKAISRINFDAEVLFHLKKKHYIKPLLNRLSRKRKEDATREANKLNRDIKRRLIQSIVPEVTDMHVCKICLRNYTRYHDASKRSTIPPLFPKLDPQKRIINHFKSKKHLDLIQDVSTCANSTKNPEDLNPEDLNPEDLENPFNFINHMEFTTPDDISCINTDDMDEDEMHDAIEEGIT